MSFRFSQKTSVGRNIHRVACRECDEASEALRQFRKSHDQEKIHQARKSVKKLRALLRFSRQLDSTDRVYRKHNRILRDAGRELSGIRDVHVQLMTLEGLATNNPQLRHFHAYRRVRNELEDHREDCRKKFASEKPDRKARRKIKKVRRSVERWEGCFDWSAVGGILSLAFGLAREALTLAKKKRSDDLLHEWRKQTKDLWYHLRLLEKVLPAAGKKWTPDLEVLGESLGLDHDLAVLDQTIIEIDEGRSDCEVLRSVLHITRLGVQKEALQLGQKLFVNRAAEFKKLTERVRAKD